MATTDNNTIEKAMIDLANDVATDAKGTADDKRCLADKIDALKTLTAVYAALKKHKTDDPDEDQGNGFDFSKGVVPEEPPNESSVTRLPARRRPG